MLDKSPTAETIFSSETVHVVHRQGTGDTVIVTFNELSMKAGGNRFWGDTLLAREEIPAIGFVSTKPNWFPPSQMTLAVATAQEIITRYGYRSIIVYGYSQGAYGAIRYGKFLGARIIVAFSPQYSINPEEVGSFDRRYLSFYTNNSESMAIGGDHIASEPLVVFDPYDKADATHIALIGDKAKLLCVPCPFLGHHSIRILSETGSSSEAMKIFRLATSPDKARMKLRALLRAARRRSVNYWIGLGFALRRHRRFAQSLPCFREALKFKDCPASAQVGLAQSLIALRRPDEAKVVLVDAIASPISSTDVLYHLCEALRKIGAHPEALDAARKRLIISADKLDARLQLAACLAQTGEISESVKMLNAEIGVARRN